MSEMHQDGLCWEAVFYFPSPYFKILHTADKGKGLFTRSDTVTVTVKVQHQVNGDGILTFKMGLSPIGSSPLT